MRIDWSARARRNLADIYEYLEERSPTAAARVRDAIWQEAQLLADYPELGRATRSPGVRQLVIARTPYIILYTANRSAGAVIILRVFHGAQVPPEDL